MEEKLGYLGPEGLAAYKKRIESMTPKELYDHLHKGMKDVRVYYYNQPVPEEILEADEEWRLAVGGEYVEQRSPEQIETARIKAAQNGHAPSGTVESVSCPTHEEVSTLNGAASSSEIVVPVVLEDENITRPTTAPIAA